MMTMLIAVIMRVWDSWDVRGMVILSLILQIILFLLGDFRRYSVNHWIRYIGNAILWLANKIADLVASAALLKLCSTCLHESAPGPINFLRGFWASSLLLHLGGPDTITAYGFPDNLLWMSHLLQLVYRSALTIYVIRLSWTKSWLSLLNIPLFFAGIIKYLEKTWCNYLALSKDSSRTAPLFHGKILSGDAQDPTNNRDDDEIWVENNLTEERKILLAHRWFVLKRQYMEDIFSKIGSVRSLKEKMLIHMDDIVYLARGRTNDTANDTVNDETNDRRNDKVRDDYWLLLVQRSPITCLFDIAKIELGFMLDMLYSKSAIIYTKVGFIAHLISFCFCLIVSVFLWNCVSIRDQPGYYWSNMDIRITIYLLVGGVLLELYGLYLVLSSDWFVVLRYIYRGNCLLQIFSRCSWLKPREKKRIQDHMGQFNLSRYCMSLTNNERTWTNFLRNILQKICTEEMMIKFWHTSFIIIPKSLEEPECFPEILNRRTPTFTRGEMALQKHSFTDEMVIETLSMDLGATIMIWHIATDICHLGLGPNQITKTVTTCTVISNYMMYLLVIKPSMVSEDSNFWFASFTGKLRKLLQENGVIPLTNYNNIYELCAETIKERGASFPVHARGSSFAPYAVQVDKGIWVAKCLSRAPNIWVMLKEVWLEMMQYAAMCCPRLSHLQELSEGSELLSLYWLLANSKMHIEAVEDQLPESEQKRRLQEGQQRQQLQEEAEISSNLPTNS